MIITGRKLSFLEQVIFEFKEVYRFRYVVYSFVQTNLKLRYRRSALGFIWTVLAPMLHYIVIGLVFSVLMGNRRADYFVYYFSGALFFALITGVLNRAPMVFIANENFIKKIYIPKLTFILNAVSIELTNFLLSGTSLILLGILMGKFVLSPYIVLSLIPVFLAAVALLGLSCLLSVAAVYFRDLTHIIPVVIQAAFFATPVIYDESMIPLKYHWLITYNPAYYFLKLFRVPLLEQRLPDANSYGIATTFSVICLLLGLWVVKKFENKIVFKL